VGDSSRQKEANAGNVASNAVEIIHSNAKSLNGTGYDIKDAMFIIAKREGLERK